MYNAWSEMYSKLDMCADSAECSVVSGEGIVSAI